MTLRFGNKFAVLVLNIWFAHVVLTSAPTYDLMSLLSLTPSLVPINHRANHQESEGKVKIITALTKKNKRNPLQHSLCKSVCGETKVT